ncbi:universal stress protein [Oceanibacterium hippocampi]|uniref:Universal stress protein family protein n=1 Tax=Oceanibacterium hippocampi TaxID=745714 RepID=A0A1Y5T3F7_9PROT|nr:universal stress protein [Oceanibacterium hippocampi]SLN54903.1 Universal stress protein family protein [Oceanibacterium hippocampi]
MTIKSILVHCDNDKFFAKRLNMAANLAQAHDAHVVGLFVITPVQMPTYAAVPISQEIWDMVRQRSEEAAAKAKKNFEELTRRAGVSAEWRLREGPLADLIADHALYADLVFLGQAGEPQETGYVDFDLTGDVAFSSRRPVITVPYAGKSETIGRNVLVAWRPTAESSRAVHDALPILQKAERVVVLTVNSKDEGDLPGADISQHLAQHGVRAEVRKAVAQDMEVGNVILNEAADQNIDLLVMGAYGHSRTRELVFGGATRHLLHHMTVPVFMSR